MAHDSSKKSHAKSQARPTQSEVTAQKFAAGGLPFSPTAMVRPSWKQTLLSTKTQYDQYNKAADTYNAALNKYQSEVYNPYVAQVEAYNKAAEEYNAGAREADFTMAEPTAPAEFALATPTAPSMSQADYEALAKRASTDVKNRNLALAVAADPERFGLSINKFFAEGGEARTMLDDIVNAAQQDPNYQSIEKYLRARDAMPAIRLETLPPDAYGAFSSDNLNIGSGRVKLSEDIYSKLGKKFAPSILAHEMAHAADRQMKQQAIEQRGEGNKFTEAYEKLVGPEGRNRTELVRRLNPEWEADNRTYRASPREIAGHAVGAFAGPTMQDRAPRHVDPTAATEYQILLDLAQRHVNEGPKGIAKIPAFFKKLLRYSHGGEVEPRPKDLEMARSPNLSKPARPKKKGVPSKNGGMVERSSQDNRKYL